MPQKSTIKAIFPSLKAPQIRRRHLRKYSWLPDVFRLKGSIIKTIFGPVLTVTLFATLVAYAAHTGREIILTNSVVPMISVVVGLILVFRNGSSYDRYWEGRKSFASVTSSVRNLSRSVWVNVAPPPTDISPPYAKGKTPNSNVTLVQLRHRKTDALHLMVALAFSIKHYLRGEDGLDWDDYNGLLPVWFISNAKFRPNSYLATSGANSLMGSTENLKTPVGTLHPDATKRIRVKRSKNQIASPVTPLLSTGQGHHSTVEFQELSIPLPLMIAYELSSMIFQFRREGLLETVGPAGANAMNQSIHSITDHLTAMERIANTPIPISYGIHLKQCVTLYLFALPMMLVHDLKWLTIPVTTIVAFMFMGIEGIADEIEMPFGMDPGDLPLDRYCSDLREEVEFMIQRLPDTDEGSHGYDDGEGDD